MCHTTILKQQQSEQIEKFVENGMPVKLVKKVNFIINRKNRQLQKEEEQHQQEQLQQQEQQQQIEELLLNLTEENIQPTPSMQEENEISSLPLAAETKTTQDSFVEEEMLATEPLSLEVADFSLQKDLASSEISEKVSKEEEAATSHMATSAEATEPSTTSISAPTTKILTCPFTAHKRVVVLTPEEIEKKKQEQLANIASFHFKDRKLSLKGTLPMTPEKPIDALALTTQLTKQFFDFLGDQMEKFQSSHISTILTKTTQPAHLIGVAIVVLVLLTVGPDLIENNPQKLQANVATNLKMKNEMNSSSSGTGSGGITMTSSSMSSSSSSKSANNTTNVLATILYLGAFATHFGSQIWMTFISGLSLYFELPRHIFGQCQQILFPRYFAFNGMLSILMLILYVKFFFTSWSIITTLQISALALSAVIEMTVRLYLAPPMLVLMHEKYKIEDTVGSGQEVGMIVQGDLAQCPHYQRIHKAFRRSHMIIAIGNMTVLMCTFVLLFSLATKIQMS